MDRRTADLLDALTHPGGALLELLLAGDATEAELAVEIDAPQPTVHRRLHRLEELGLVSRMPGAWRSPNRSYRISLPDEVRALLIAAAGASHALAEAEDRARAAMVERIQRSNPHDSLPSPARRVTARPSCRTEATSRPGRERSP